MVTDHRQDIAESKHESSSGRDPQVKQRSGETLPTLEDHLKMAGQVDSKVTGAPASSAQPK